MLTRIFKGDYYQNGFELGQDLKNAGYSSPVLPEDRLKLADECEKIVRQHTPKLIEELEGILDGGKYHDTHMKAFSLSLSEYPILGCSVFAISKRYMANAKTIFARNYDWDKWVAEYSVFWKSYPEGALASISGSDLFVGRYGGLNESGLAIAVTAIRGYHGDVPGVALHYLIRWILDTCRNVPEASSFLQKVPHFRGNNYLLADSDDRLAAVEATPKAVIVKDDTERGFALVTNHFQSSETMIYENEDLIPVTSKPRFNHIHSWFSSQKNGITESQVQDILCNKLNSKTGVCEDRSYKFRGEEIPYGTIWTWTAYPGDRWIHLTHPTYNQRKFQKMTF
jgi:predicted choloylglycine hydrolase